MTDIPADDFAPTKRAETVINALGLATAAACIWGMVHVYQSPEFQAQIHHRQIETAQAAPAPAQAEPAVVSSPRPPRSERRCLAENIFREARGESLKGQVAVGHVTLNRTKAGYKGAKTICETVYMRKQFSWTLLKHLPQPPADEWARSLEIADKLLAGRYINRTKGAHSYYNPKKVDAWWADSYEEVAVIGNHRFMR